MTEEEAVEATEVPEVPEVSEVSEVAEIPEVKEEPKVSDEPKIVFYCKDCGEIVETNRAGRKYVYMCKKCGTKNVAFGTEASIYGFFRLDDKEEEVETPSTTLKGLEEKEKREKDKAARKKK